MLKQNELESINKSIESDVFELKNLIDKITNDVIIEYNNEVDNIAKIVYPSLLKHYKSIYFINCLEQMSFDNIKSMQFNGYEEYISNAINFVNCHIVQDIITCGNIDIDSYFNIFKLKLFENLIKLKLNIKMDLMPINNVIPLVPRSLLKRGNITVRK